MVRRCQFLENCPALQLNDGTGVPILDENGKNSGKYTDISKLRSTLLKKMLEEVTKFCDRDMVKSWNQQNHQQVIHQRDGCFTIFWPTFTGLFLLLPMLHSLYMISKMGVLRLACFR